MESLGMGMNIPKSSEQNTPKFVERANEIKKNVPENQLSQVISELEQYIQLRRLNENQYEDLPEDLREEIGTIDPMDEFIERVGNFDPWDTLTDEYGFAPDSQTPKWTIDELENLIKELKK